MPDNTAHDNDFQDLIKEFLDANVAYYKLYLLKVIAKSSASILGILAVAACALISLFFLSAAAAIALGYLFDNMAIGFLTIGAVYLLITFIFVINKDRILEHYIVKKFSDFF